MSLFKTQFKLQTPPPPSTTLHIRRGLTVNRICVECLCMPMSAAQTTKCYDSCQTDIFGLAQGLAMLPQIRIISHSLLITISALSRGLAPRGTRKTPTFVCFKFFPLNSAHSSYPAMSASSFLLNEADRESGPVRE